MSEYTEDQAQKCLAQIDKRHNNPLGERTRMLILEYVKVTIDKAMRDQRDACAEAMVATDLGVFNVSTIVQSVRGLLNQAIMNAEVKR